jgi:hypothetical protein
MEGYGGRMSILTPIPGGAIGDGGCDVCSGSTSIGDEGRQRTDVHGQSSGQLYNTTARKDTAPT